MNPTVFLDTVGLLAVWNIRDQWHQAALQAYNKLQISRVPVLATTYVLAECANAVARRPARLDAVNLYLTLEASHRLIRPTEVDWSASWRAYRAGENAQAGIVDQISFVVMGRLGITQAFSNDQHFRAAGFQTLF